MSIGGEQKLLVLKDQLLLKMIPRTKQLETVEILDLYDAPIVIVLIDTFGAHYLGFCFATAAGMDSFVATPISVARYRNIRNGNMDIRFVFENPESREFYRIDIDGSENLITASLLDSAFELDESFLPVDDYFVDLDDVESRIGPTSYRIPGVHEELDSKVKLRVDESVVHSIKVGVLNHFYIDLTAADLDTEALDIRFTSCSSWVKKSKGLSSDLSDTSDVPANKEPELSLAA
jgi:hypothetical protein